MNQVFPRLSAFISTPYVNCVAATAGHNPIQVLLAQTLANNRIAQQGKLQLEMKADKLSPGGATDFKDFLLPDVSQD